MADLSVQLQRAHSSLVSFADGLKGSESAGQLSADSYAVFFNKVSVGTGDPELD